MKRNYFELNPLVVLGKKKKKYYMGWYEYLNCKYSNISPTHKQTSLIHFPLEQINKKDYISDPHVKIQSY